MPGYSTAKNEILNYIAKKELKAGDQFPTEGEFSEELGLSRLALRDALNALKSDGIIFSVQGRGTFLCFDYADIRNTLNNCVSITQMIIDSGRKPGMSLFHKELVEASGQLAAKLRVAEGSSVICCTRIRLADDRPVAYTKDYLAPELTPKFLSLVPTQDFSIGRFLTEQCGVTFGAALSELKPILADKLMADMLGVETGTPMMFLQDLDQDVYGNPLVYAEEKVLADAFRFIVRRFN